MLSPEIKLNSNYRCLDTPLLLPNGPVEKIEIRKYAPMRKTIRTTRGDYFCIPLPYQVYIARQYNPDYNGFRTLDEKRKCIHVMFALEGDDRVYPSPWSRPGGAVCVDTLYHVYFPISMDMGEIIGKYWATDFDVSSPILSRLFGFLTLKEWAGMSVDEIVEYMRGHMQQMAFVSMEKLMKDLVRV